VFLSKPNLPFAWHTFWSESDQPGRVLELISPAGFERYFEELISLDTPFQPSKLLELAAQYELELDLSSIPRLIEQYKVRLTPSQASPARGRTFQNSRTPPVHHPH
jgi:hypothetical protein